MGGGGSSGERRFIDSGRKSLAVCVRACDVCRKSEKKDVVACVFNAGVLLSFKVLGARHGGGYTLPCKISRNLAFGIYSAERWAVR